ncbi:hypothetical protein Dimus_039749 [Dionaea muscipula]
MILAFWNIRGFNKTLKHKEVQRFLRVHEIDLFALLETKIAQASLDSFMAKYFEAWKFTSNFSSHPAGRILMLWNPRTTSVNILCCTDQLLHGQVVFRTTGKTFWLSIAYGLYSVTDRRQLWDQLIHLGSSTSMPWLLGGDLNNVCDVDDRLNGAPVQAYETADIRRFMHETSMMDLPYIGNKYTWTNGRTWCKLDRAMANHHWFTLEANAAVEFHPLGIFSDHAACTIRCFQSQRIGRHPFKYLNMWGLHESFSTLIHDRWEMEVHGCNQFCITRKLQYLKRDLQALNEKHFSHISNQVSRTKKEIEDAYHALSLDPPNQLLQAELSRLKKHGEWLAKAELSFLTQKAKAHYFRNCDRSTSFFHALIRKKAARSQLVSIIEADGSPTTSLQEMGLEFIKFYQGLLGSSNPVTHGDWTPVHAGPKVSMEDQQLLCIPITNDEVKDALWTIGDNKALGPDGYSAGFFKKAWHIIGDDICNAIREFFSTGQLLRQLNHAIIVLLPKHTNANRVEEFRPIACCNVLYKLISKILAARISPVLDYLIDPCQAAFIRGRLMRDNIFLVQELLRQYTRKRISPRCFFQIDLKKAYDSVEWIFLKQMLEALHFPPMFIKWIMTCVNTVTYSISLNGHLFGFFKGMRGLRQGDPISPYLFVICLEFLSRHLQQLQNTHGFTHHLKCRELNITHLAFADDLILLSRADSHSVSALLKCLNTFSGQSGLTVSLAKSQFFGAGLDAQLTDYLINTSGFNCGSFPIKYLGVPLAALRITYIHFKPLIDRIGSYIEGWLRKTLLYAGRLELIKSVLQGVDCFWMSIFPIPNAVLDAIIWMCRFFLFGANVKNPPVSWNFLSAPKREGGLGIFHLQTWNQALLFSNIWNIHMERQSLWIKWVNQIYLRGSSIWNWQPGKEASTFMKHMIHTRDLIMMNVSSVDRLQAYIARPAGNHPSITSLFYELLRYKRTPVFWSKIIWHKHIEPKVSFVLWMATLNRLRTRCNIRGGLTDPTCPLCHQITETANHLFFMCCVTGEVWRRINDWLRLPPSLRCLPRILRWMKKYGRGNGIKAGRLRLALATSVYYIWKARNEIIWHQRPFDSSSITRTIKIHMYQSMYSNFPMSMLDSYFELP